MGPCQLPRLWSLLLLLVCLGGLTQCGVLVAERSGRRASSQDPARELFREAEQAYRQKDYDHARTLYQAIVNGYPQSTLLVDATFRLGEIHYYQGRYEDAQQAFSAFLNRFPQSNLAPDAVYVQGLSLLHLKRFSEARALLEQAQQRFPDPRHRGYFLLALAKVTVAEGQRLHAIEQLQALMAGREFPEDVRTQARDVGIELVEQHLTPAELASVKSRWPLEFPTDYILLRQAREAWNQKRISQAEALAQEFLTKFPDHPQAQQMQALLSTIEQSRTASVDKHKIGVILPLSSPPRREWVGEVGQSALQGIQVAFAREGFSPLKMEVRDSKADLTVTAAAMEELSNTQGVIAIVGPLFNETTAVAFKKALQYRVPLISPGAPSLEFPADNPYVLRNSFSNRLEARRLAEYAVGRLGLRRFAMLSPDDQAGRELADTFQQRVVELGGEVVIQRAYPPNQTDFTPLLRQLGGQTDEELRAGSTGQGGAPSMPESAESRAASGRLPYNALYLPRSFERLQFLVPALTLYNLTGIALLGESGWNHPELSRRGGALIEGAVFMDGFFAGSSDRHVQEFVQSYRAMFRTDPDLMAAQSYDAMLMLLRVLKERPQTREEAREKLRNLRDFRGATGRLSVLPTGDVEKPLFVLTVRRGKIVQLD
jgi:branched-chain amino acid transport system substrate-binding protein